MRLPYFISCVAASVSAIQGFGNTSTSDFLSLGTSLTCSGTSTYSFTPLETVFVTVDGNYTYTDSVSGSTPADIYYTPPPPCSSVIETDPPPVVVPSTILSVSTMVFSLPNTTSSTSHSTSTSSVIIVTKTTTSWTNICVPRFSTTFSNTTSTIRGPYANSSSVTTVSSVSEDCSLSFTQFLTTETETPSPIQGHPHPAPLIPTADSATNGPVRTTELVTATVGISTVVSSRTSNVFKTPPATAVTVTVTKKTPVPPVTPNSQGVVAPGPTFPGNNQDPPITIKSTLPRTSTSTLQPGTMGPGNNNPLLPSTTGNANDVNRPTGNPGTGPSTTQNRIPSQSPGSPNLPNSGGNNNNNNVASSSGSAAPPRTVTGGSGLGSIINSAFNSPFTAVIGVTTSLGAASATATLIAGVPVQAGSSSVYIGGSYVALPTGTSAAFATVAGQTFTVLQSEVIAGTTTLNLNRPQSVSYTAIQAATQAASTITRSGVTITIQPTAAVVSGTTYIIGLNAPLTVATVNGQTITFNSNGVAFASTTYAPALITAPAYVVTTIGAITISIDQSQAIIDGTTYMIGSGSSHHQTTAVVDGTTITFGSSGIVLPSTTIAPTSVKLTGLVSSKTSAGAATRVLSNTSAATSSGIGIATSRPPSFLSNTFCITALVLAYATLPLSLVL